MDDSFASPHARTSTRVHVRAPRPFASRPFSSRPFASRPFASRPFASWPFSSGGDGSRGVHHGQPPGTQPCPRSLFRALHRAGHRRQRCSSARPRFKHIEYPHATAAGPTRCVPRPARCPKPSCHVRRAVASGSSHASHNAPPASALARIDGNFTVQRVTVKGDCKEVCKRHAKPGFSQRTTSRS